MNFVPFCESYKIATSETVNMQVDYYESFTHLVSVTEKSPLSVSNPVRVAKRLVSQKTRTYVEHRKWVRNRNVRMCSWSQSGSRDPPMLRPVQLTDGIEDRLVTFILQLTSGDASFRRTQRVVSASDLLTCFLFLFFRP